ncbi:hypothetical protein ACEWY4_024843 [Coilia grayii]|uniref:THAP-type domain-containing protein n=1 Tax=Coilia grayii TaxID=363190 RepID=A0ABD1IW44_9TELE
MVCCVIHGCSNSSNKDHEVHFYSIPAVRKREGKETEELTRRRRELWLVRINRRDFQPTPHSKVCSDHFITGNPSYLHDSTHPDWAPSLKLAGETGQTEKAERSSGKSMARYNRVQSRVQKLVEKAQGQASPDKNSVTTEVDEVMDETEEGEACASQTCSVLRADHQRLLTENVLLKHQIASDKISMDTLRDNRKVRFYTGLPSFATLMVLFNFVEGSLTDSVKISFNKFQKLVLVLMKLRHNFPEQDLAYRFGISQSTVSKTFISVTHVLYVKLKKLIFWPRRDELWKSMPITFRQHFGSKVTVIIDCFEIFIEKPSSLTARSHTWSSYKHHNTIKYLIGITPQGSISFLSKAWGGRTTDKHITENSGLLELLTPGDLILADRGFNVQESVGLKCATIMTPSYTRGKLQLSPLEVEATRKIAHVRIHVERVIGLVRNKYAILSERIPISYLVTSGSEMAFIDKITTVCCCLTNMCPSVVAFD